MYTDERNISKTAFVTVINQPIVGTVIIKLEDVIHHFKTHQYFINNQWSYLLESDSHDKKIFNITDKDIELTIKNVDTLIKVCDNQYVTYMQQKEIMSEIQEICDFKSHVIHILNRDIERYNAYSKILIELKNMHDDN